jgi:hypothetical protein
MKTHKFTFSFKEHKDSLSEYWEGSMENIELNVLYNSSNNHLIICGCEMEVRTCTGTMMVDMLPVIVGFGGYQYLIRAAAAHYKTLKVKANGNIHCS